MHDIWNPWHGCKKCSEGCENCYMYFLDAQRGKNGSDIYRTKSGFNYPLSKDRHGRYKVQSGEQLRVCMTSDFFLEEADEWRNEAWNIIRQRPDVIFFLLTKRPERVKDHLPYDWGDGWENVFFNVSCENQKRADERIPILLSLPFKHKGIMCAPFIGEISIKDYLKSGQLVKRLRDECEEYNVTFAFIGTGRRFVKDGKTYQIEGSELQANQAYKSGLSFKGKPIDFKLTRQLGFSIAETDYYKPYFGEKCQTCGMKIICNGCTRCGKCNKE